jgi:competence ComEA-like helix-hairpin-helix protein
LNRSAHSRGFAVAAARSLCDDSRPVARGYGLAIIEQLNATIAEPSVRKLDSDQARMKVPGSDHLGGAIVGAFAKSVLREPRTVASLAEQNERCMQDLAYAEGFGSRYFDGIRHYAKRDYAGDYQEQRKRYESLDWYKWWESGRPVWKAWRRYYRPNMSFDDREAYLNWLRRATNRFTMDRKQVEAGGGSLQVVEPVGGRCRMYDGENQKLVAEGDIPFEVRLSPKMVRREFPNMASFADYQVTLRVFRERAEYPVGRGVPATLPGGRIVVRSRIPVPRAPMPPVDPAPQPEPTRLVNVALLRYRDQRVVIGLLVAAFLAMAGLRLADYAAGRTVVDFEDLPERPVVLRVDLNRAGEVDLAELPVIGPAVAKKIVEYRRAHGPFRKLDHLDRVPGIGPHTLEAIRPHVVITAE